MVRNTLLVFSILVAVLIFTISIYLVYRVFAVKRAKANIQKINLAINTEDVYKRQDISLTALLYILILQKKTQVKKTALQS